MISERVIEFTRSVFYLCVGATIIYMDSRQHVLKVMAFTLHLFLPLILSSGLDNKVTVYPLVEDDSTQRKKPVGTHTSVRALFIYDTCQFLEAVVNGISESFGM